MSNADLTAIIDGDSKELIKALADASEEMKKFEDGTGASLKKLDEQFKSTFGGISETIGAVKATLITAAPVAIFNLLHSEVQKGIEEFKRIGDEADRLRVTTDFFQTLGYQAKEANTNFDHVREGVKTFGDQLSKLKNDEGDLQKSLQGHNDALLTQLKNATTVEAAMRLLADAITKLKSPYDQAKLSGQAFGSANADIAHILNEGAAGFDKAAQAVQKYGLLVDEHVIRHSQVIRSDFEQLSNVLGTKFREALLNIAPILKKVGDETYKLSEALRRMWEVFEPDSAKSTKGLEEELTRVQETAKTAADTLEGYWAEADERKKGWHFSLFGDHFEENLKREEKNYSDAVTRMESIEAELEKRKKEKRESPSIEAAPKDQDDSAARLLEGQHAIDELMRKFYSDTHQYYQMIEADEQKDRDRFKLLLEEKKITQEQYSKAMEIIAKDEAAKIEESLTQTREHMRSALSSVSSEFEKVMSDWQSGSKITFQSILKDFTDMAEKMVLKMAVLEPLFGTGKTGVNEFGLVGDLFKKGGILSGVFHEGGVAGAANTMRVLEPGVFSSAIRYHEGGIAGLQPGEVPAILQEGETIIPKGGAAGVGAFHMPITIDARGAYPETVEKLKSEIERLRSEVPARAVSAIHEAKKRGML